MPSNNKISAPPPHKNNTNIPGSIGYSTLSRIEGETTFGSVFGPVVDNAGKTVDSVLIELIVAEKIITQSRLGEESRRLSSTFIFVWYLPGVTCNIYRSTLHDDCHL